MPTARELLEQADALMRRNRAAAVDDIPVLTDSVALPAELPPAAVPAFTDVAAPAPRAAAHVPTLTEAVAVTDDKSVDSVIQEGEPSDWLHLEHGDPSIIGDAPDSIAIVPQVARPPVSDAEAIASTELEEIELTTPADEAFDDEFEPVDTYAAVDAMPPENPPHAVVEAVTPAPPSTEAWFAPWSSPGATPAPPFEAEAPAMQALSTEPFAVPSDATAIVEVPAQEETAALRLQETMAAAMSPPAEETTTAAFATPLPASAPPAVAIGDDPAKWDAIAEEIRMQVLQRIDLFTDTGLREQLGMRLKPIVDRASADLVATINLHVGELLRAYVAEAIEREIESWRSNH